MGSILSKIDVINFLSSKNIAILSCFSEFLVIGVLILIYFMVFSLICKDKRIQKAKDEKLEKAKNEKENRILDTNAEYFSSMYFSIHGVVLFLSTLYFFEYYMGVSLSDEKNEKIQTYQIYYLGLLFLTNCAIHRILYEMRVYKNHSLVRKIYLLIIISVLFAFKLFKLYLYHLKYEEYSFFAFKSLDDIIFTILYASEVIVLIVLFILPFCGNAFTHYYKFSDKKDANKLEQVLVKIQMMFPLLWPDDWLLRLCFMACCALTFIVSYFNFYLSIKTAELVDMFSNKDSLINPRKLLTLFAIVGVLRILKGDRRINGGGLIFHLKGIAWEPISNSIVEAVSVRVYSHVQTLHRNWFASHDSASLQAYVNRGSSSANLIAQHAIFELFSHLQEIIVVMIFLVKLRHTFIPIIVVITVASCVIFSYFTNRMKSPVKTAESDYKPSPDSFAPDVLMNIDTVKVCSNTDAEILRYSEALEYSHKEEQKQMYWNIFLAVAKNIIIVGGFIIGCIYCITDVLVRGKGRNDYITFVNYLSQLYDPLTWLESYLMSIKFLFRDIDNILEILLTPNELTVEISRKDRMKKITIPNGCDCPLMALDRKIYTSFEQNELKFEAGKVYAIVGASGCGKTFLLNAIYSEFKYFHHKETDKIKYSNSIGFVPQNVNLFNQNLIYNIFYGNTTLKEEEMENALEDLVKEFPIPPLYKHCLLYLKNEDHIEKSLTNDEQTLTVLIRELLRKPKVLLIDQALDTLLPEITNYILNYTSKSKSSEAITIIVSDAFPIVSSCQGIVFIDNSNRIHVKKSNENFKETDVQKEYDSLWKIPEISQCHLTLIE